MSGVYNYHIKVENPTKMLPQMASHQPPFYFGGSQVPINLGLKNHMLGEGLGKKHLLKTQYIPRTPLRK